MAIPALVLLLLSCVAHRALAQTAPSGAAGPADSVFVLPGSAVAGTSAAPLSAGGAPAYAADRFGAAQAALALPAGALLATAPLPQLPTGGAARTLHAAVKCAPAAAAAGPLFLMGLSDGGAAPNSLSEHFAVFVAAPGAANATAVSPAFQVSPLAGSAISAGVPIDGVTTSAKFLNPTASAVNPVTGFVYVVDKGDNAIRAISRAGVVSTIAGNLSGAAGFANSAAGTSASFSNPLGICIDPVNYAFLLVCDTANRRIRRVSLTPPYAVTTVAGTGVSGGVDGPALLNATFQSPVGITMDRSGNVFVGDIGTTAKIRMLSADGSTVSTLVGTGAVGNTGPGYFAGNATMLSSPRGIALHPSNPSVLYIADQGNFCIRKVDASAGLTSGAVNVSTFAGQCGTFGFADGPATSALFGGNGAGTGPYGISVDGAGYVFVADQGSSRIRRISPAGFVKSVVGGGVTSGANLFGVGDSMFLSTPTGIASADGAALGAGSLVITAFGNNRVLLAATSGVAAFTAPLCDATWHTVDALSDPVLGLALYVDGALAASNASGASNLWTAGGAAVALSVGGSPRVGASAYFSGLLADVRVYNRTLTQAELTALAQPALPSFTNAAAWPATQTSSATNYTWTCVAGSSGGPPVILARSPADGSWAFAGGVASLTCTTCPPGSWSAANATACTSCPGGALNQSFTGGSSISVCASPSPSPSGTSSPSVSGTPPASLTPSPSSTPSLSSSPTPTLSTTSTSSLTSSTTPSPTLSLSATPTPTSTQTPTPSNTPTPTQTPSPSSVPNVVVAFNLTLAPSAMGGTTLTGEQEASARLGAA